MPTAYFNAEPDALAAAQVLRDLGFTADVRLCGTEPYDERVKKFFEGQGSIFGTNAVVESDADAEAFATVITRHHGLLEPIE
ncbi:MAG: hypothetical protein ACXWNK_16510 [Vulcanimicrobiaceae bacterium]